MRIFDGGMGVEFVVCGVMECGGFWFVGVFLSVFEVVYQFYVDYFCVGVDIVIMNIYLMVLSYFVKVGILDQFDELVVFVVLFVW